MQVTSDMGDAFGLSTHGLSIVCETCESDIDFQDEHALDHGVCRQCGIAFLMDAAPAANARLSQG